MQIKCFLKENVKEKLKGKFKLKGKIIIGYCRAQETFIIFIRLQGYKDQYKRLLARKFSQTNNGKRV